MLAIRSNQTLESEKVFYIFAVVSIIKFYDEDGPTNFSSQETNVAKLAFKWNNYFSTTNIIKHPCAGNMARYSTGSVTLDQNALPLLYKIKWHQCWFIYGLIGLNVNFVAVLRHILNFRTVPFAKLSFLHKSIKIMEKMIFFH